MPTTLPCLLWNVRNDLWMTKQICLLSIISAKPYQKLQKEKLNLEKLWGWQVIKNHNCNPFQSFFNFVYPCLFLYSLSSLYSQTSLKRTPKGQNQVSALQRCLYYRQTSLKRSPKGQSQVSALQRCPCYRQTSLIRTPKGQSQVSALQRCPYYRGRECMIFGISETKRTVRNREVSVL